MFRAAASALIGTAVAVVSAVVLGDYPVTGAVMWTAAVVVPLLVGVSMVLVAGASRPRAARWWWVATGFLSAGSTAWGLRIATGWGLDPTPVFAWLAVAVSGLWPGVWGLRLSLR